MRSSKVSIRRANRFIRSRCGPGPPRGNPRSRWAIRTRSVGVGRRCRSRSGSWRGPGRAGPRAGATGIRRQRPGRWPAGDKARFARAVARHRRQCRPLPAAHRRAPAVRPAARRRPRACATGLGLRHRSIKGRGLGIGQRHDPAHRERGARRLPARPGSTAAGARSNSGGFVGHRSSSSASSAQHPRAGFGVQFVDARQWPLGRCRRHGLRQLRQRPAHRRHDLDALLLQYPLHAADGHPLHLQQARGCR